MQKKPDEKFYVSCGTTLGFNCNLLFLLCCQMWQFLSFILQLFWLCSFLLLLTIAILAEQDSPADYS